jgi:ABC-2 type transport system permease protein
MRSFWALFIVTLKNTLSLVDSGKKKSIWTRLLPAFLVVAFIPTLFSFYMMAEEALKLLIPLQQAGIILGLMLTAMSLMIFFLAIFLIPAVFYFSKDVEVLLALPLKAHTIVSAKLAVSMIYEYISVFIIGLPVLAAYVVNVKPEPLFYLITLVVLIFAPLIPLILAGLIVMIVMALFPKARNRDLFNYLSGFVALAFAIGINLSVNSVVQIDSQSMITLLIQGNNSLTGIFGYMIPSIPFALNAMVHLKLVDLLISVAIAGAFVIIFLGISDVVYFMTAVGVNETGASRKKLKDKAYSKMTLRSNPILTYTFKELKLMIRTPIYLLNNISTVILMPVILLGSLMTGVGSQDEVIVAIKTIPWDDPNVLAYVLAAGAAIGLFMSSLNLITVTAISREGSNVYFMKFIPMSYFKQIQAKVYSGLLISFLGIVFMLVPFGIILSIPPLFIFLAFIAALLSGILINYIGIIVDMIRPKLVWEQEAAAVKQNLNAAFTMIPAMGLGVGIFFTIGLFPQPMWFAFTLYLVLFILDIGALMVTKKTCKKAFDQI